jgi:hypothetical protein
MTVHLCEGEQVDTDCRKTGVPDHFKVILLEPAFGMVLPECFIISENVNPSAQFKTLIPGRNGLCQRQMIHGKTGHEQGDEKYKSFHRVIFKRLSGLA